ncbi:MULTISPECIES: hypothetical protein [unclassified Iodidimonas]|jgi:hypothetical protein|uniref:NfrA family protein n=1 Tax=unclassified Iodidimonas TaxID=2626145 RepID=UPI0024824D21|nr:MULTISPECIES: hypothetical protein [unclassified Iodidimonas]
MILIRLLFIAFCWLLSFPAVAQIEVRVKPQNPPLSPHQAATEAYQALNAGDQAMAADFLALAIEQTADEARRHQWALDLGHIQSALDRHAQAAQSFLLAFSIRPEAESLASAGYALLAAGDQPAARDVFAQLVEKAPDHPVYHRQLAYLCRNDGDMACARTHFTTALGLDHDPLILEQTRREMRALDRIFWGSASLLWRTDGPDDESLFLGDRVLSQSQGIIEANGRLPLWLGSPDRWIAGFARLLWSVDGADPLPQAKSEQAGFGFKLKPFASQAIIVGAERLVSVGDFARDDWLFRISGSWGAGYERPVAHQGPSWLFWSVFGDIAGIGIEKTDWQISGEGRIGRSWQKNRFILTPHLLLSGLWQDDRSGQNSLLEGGPGLTIALPFGGSARQAPAHKIELTTQLRINLAGTSDNDEGLSIILSVSF